MAEELRRVNEVIQQWLRHDGRQIAHLDGIPTDACRHMLFKQIYGDYRGPQPHRDSDDGKQLALGNEVVSRGEARRRTLDIIDVLSVAMTRTPDSDGNIDQSEASANILSWLYTTTPAADVPTCQTPLLQSAYPRPERSPSPGPMDASKDTDRPAVDQEPQLKNAYPSSVTQPSQPPNPQHGNFIHMPIVAPIVPQYRFPTVGTHMGFPQHPPAPYQGLPVLLNGPPIYANQVSRPWNGLAYPFHGYGPNIGLMVPQYLIPAPPQFGHGYPIMNQPLPVPGMDKPVPPEPSRLTLPPAERRATSSEWAKPREFNVAEWAQENRPRTPVPELRTTMNPSVSQYIPFVRYKVGNDAMFPRAGTGQSTQLQGLTASGKPTFSELINPTLFPFEGLTRYGGPPRWGVVRISNIPYGLTRQEVSAFIGRHARILTPDIGPAVHIIMDRLTGKTMDCYVEFLSNADALAWINNKNRPGQLSKLADRIPNLTMSTQDSFLEQMFPKAKNVQWNNGIPEITQSADPFNTGFKGLLTSEEMVLIVRHAEYPQRSNYTAKCLQRVFESMISTLAKFPWYATSAYTIGQRNQIFTACNDLLRVLVHNVKKGVHPSLNQVLLEELLYAGLNTPGFSEKQRWDLTRTAELMGRAVRISSVTYNWPFEVLVRKENVPEDVMMDYIDHLTLHLVRPASMPTMNPFRTFLLPPNKGAEATAKEMGELEMKCVLDIYRLTHPEKA